MIMAFLGSARDPIFFKWEVLYFFLETKFSFKFASTVIVGVFVLFCFDFFFFSCLLLPHSIHDHSDTYERLLLSYEVVLFF